MRVRPLERILPSKSDYDVIVSAVPRGVPDAGDRGAMTGCRIDAALVSTRNVKRGASSAWLVAYDVGCVTRPH